MTLSGDFLLRFALGALVAWRVTHLLALEDGPADAVFHLRRLLGQSVLGGLMDCFNCLSLWIAAPVALFVTTNLALWAMSWLGVSGAACLLERLGAAAPAQQDGPTMEGD